MQGLTLEEVIQWSDSQFRRTRTLGNYVRWGGAVVLGSAAVYAALDYFYETLKQQTGTSLDEWYYWQPNQQDWLYKILYPSDFWDSGNGCYPTITYQKYPGVWGRALGPRYPQEMYCPNVPRYGKGEIVGVFFQWSGEPPVDGYVWYEPRDYPGWLWYVRSRERPSLPEWIQQHPDAAQGVKVAANALLNNPINTPSAPYPGITLEPPPNPNQWTDNPFTRPSLDTDGDGWPDSVEWNEANRRGVPWPDMINNPNAHPDPNADPDGDGYTNEEENRYRTDPYDPNSKPDLGSPTDPNRDTDGDGWPDATEIERGTDPNDPNSHPQEEPPPQEEPQQEPAWPGGQSPNRIEPVSLPETELPSWDTFQSRWDAVKTELLDSVETKLGELQNQASTRFPFAIAGMIQFDGGQDNVSCTFQVPIADWNATINICNTPPFQLASTFRPVLVGLLYVGFGFALYRRVLDIQK